MKQQSITVVGGGLAGCEAAWAAANAGAEVLLYEMKPGRYSPAHHSPALCELVCSNSLKALRKESAAGLLKEEMVRMGSLTVTCAKECAVPAGGALAVDREGFAARITQKIESHPRIRLLRQEVERIGFDGPAVIATGPLTDGALAEEISRLCGAPLSFYDAAAPIVAFDSVNMDKAFFAARYGRGEADYINCPMDREEYAAFYQALVGAEQAELKEFDRQNMRVYEGCMPVEVMARRGEDTLRFGPLRPVGLTDPRTGRRPYAVVQLRAENSKGTLYNLVGFQTNLRFGEQKRVFSLIPGLENAEFLRYGVMHRNSFLDSPRLLNADFSLKTQENLFFAGQITGVEGYMESAASGILAGRNAAARLTGQAPFVPPETTMTGALCRHVSDESVPDFQPMGANFGILPSLGQRQRDKALRYGMLAGRALEALSEALAGNAEPSREPADPPTAP